MAIEAAATNLELQFKALAGIGLMLLMVMGGGSGTSTGHKTLLAVFGVQRCALV